MKQCTVPPGPQAHTHQPRQNIHRDLSVAVLTLAGQWNCQVLFKTNPRPHPDPELESRSLCFCKAPLTARLGSRVTDIVRRTQLAFHEGRYRRPFHVRTCSCGGQGKCCPSSHRLTLVHSPAGAHRELGGWPQGSPHGGSGRRLSPGVREKGWGYQHLSEG